MTEQEIRELLARPEGQTLDFKEAPYVLKTKEQKARFVKDIICMANTPRNENAHIVIGVRKEPDASYRVIGINSHPDEAHLQQAVEPWVRPIPQFTYLPTRLEGQQIGIIQIPPRRVGPSLPVRSSDDVLRKDTIYCRRGSMNVEADSGEQHAIWAWSDSGAAIARSRPLLVLKDDEGYWRVTNIGGEAVLNGTWQTSYRETRSSWAEFAPRPRATSQKATPKGSVQPLGPGEAESSAIYFHRDLHALLSYESLAHHKYWSRYCPLRGWEHGEGEACEGDFGCECKLNDSGYLVRPTQE
jgi:hypothetical protein